MRSLAGQFLFESLLVPSVVAALVLIAGSRLNRGRHRSFAMPTALLLAIGATYVLAFGWPINPGLGARTKIMLSAIAGLLAGLIIERHPSRSSTVIVAGAIALVVWIGFPALQHGRPVSLLLPLPIAFTLITVRLFGQTDARPPSTEGPPGLLIMTALAIGLAVIAVFAKTFSLAQISFALASALFAMRFFGPAASSIAVVTLPAAAMLLAIATALLLYSQASVLALAILGATLAADPLCRLAAGSTDGLGPPFRRLVFHMVPAALAIVVARIDAGPISLY